MVDADGIVRGGIRTRWTVYARAERTWEINQQSTLLSSRKNWVLFSKKKCDVGRKEEEKEESLEVSGRLREKRAAGKGAGNALTIRSADVNYKLYIRSTGMKEKKIWILWILYIYM